MPATLQHVFFLNHLFTLKCNRWWFTYNESLKTGGNKTKFEFCPRRATLQNFRKTLLIKAVCYIST